MPLLTVRLTDEEHGALKDLAGEGTMAELIRGWIAGEEAPARTDVVDSPVDRVDVSTSHEACDRALLDSQAQTARAKARYEPMLDVMMSIYAKTARQTGPSYLVYADVIDELRRVVDEEAAF